MTGLPVMWRDLVFASLKKSRLERLAGTVPQSGTSVNCVVPFLLVGFIRLPARTPMIGEKHGGSALSQLRYPLVFFGLSLLGIESTFGFCLARYSYSERITVALASWMGTLFILVTVIVALLTYLVPEHIMLQAQNRTNPDVLSAIKGIRETVRLLSSTEEPKSFEALSALLDQLEVILGSGN